MSAKPSYQTILKKVEYYEKVLKGSGTHSDFESLSESNITKKYLENLIEYANAPIIVWNVKFEIQRFNKAFSRLSGYSSDEALGQTLNFLFPKESTEQTNEEINRTLSGDFWETIEIPILCKTGETKIVLWNSANIYDDDKNLISTIAQGNDITERKIAEFELLIHKEKAEESDRLKTEFLNNMSHEIRTPMNGILGFSEMLNQTNLSDQKRTNFINLIQNSGKQLLTVIDDILEISRLGTKQVSVVETEVCINDVLLEIFSIFDIKAKENNTPLYLKKQLSDRQSTVSTDRAKLNKVLSNLLENALKFTNQGFIEFGYKLKNNELELYVKDTGIGIEKAKHDLIFERFSQAEKELSKKVGGLGLGLSISKENTELLGGNIRLESDKGKGSTFFVTIPYKPVYDDVEKDSDTVHKYTILIAEDEEVNYIYLETMLKDVFELDCKVIHVINGLEAMELCKENKHIDLVLMDLKMPVLNGFKATEFMKKLCPNVPIVAQTAYSTPKEKEKAMLAGCDDFISKPIHQETMSQILKKYSIMNSVN